MSFVVEGELGQKGGDVGFIYEKGGETRRDNRSDEGLRGPQTFGGTPEGLLQRAVGEEAVEGFSEQLGCISPSKESARRPRAKECIVRMREYGHPCA